MEKKHIIPCAVCDGNQRLWGKTLLGRYPVMSYEKAKKEYNNYCILICTTVNNAIEIIHELRCKGETAEVFHACNLFKVDTCLLTTQDILNESARFEKVYSLLEDELSKEILVDHINAKITGNLFSLYYKMDGETFFDLNILGHSFENEVYVDAGAYTGDTICKFIAYSGGAYKKIIAFEPDEANFKALQQFVKFGVVEHTRLVNVGLWSKKTTKSFYTMKDNSQLHYQNANLFRRIEDIADNRTIQACQDNMLEMGHKELLTDCLDNLLENETPTLIKINALAADFPILQGSKRTLCRCIPSIVLEYGTRPEYLLEEIEFLHKLGLGYRFYMRQKNIFNDSKTILYALAPQRERRENYD